MSRLSFIHNPAVSSPHANADKPEGPSRSIAQLVSSDVLSKVTPERLLTALGLRNPVVVPVDGEKQAPFSLDEVVGAKVFTSTEYEKYSNACRLVLRQLELKPGEQAVIVNGRVSLVYVIRYYIPRLTMRG